MRLKLWTALAAGSLALILLLTIVGCEAGVHADSHRVPADSVLAPVVKTVNNPDGTITTTTTTTVCTKDSKGNCSCVKTVKIETLPAPKPTSLIPVAPGDAKRRDWAQGVMPGFNRPTGEPDRIPDIALEPIPAPNSTSAVFLAISENDPATVRRVRISQGKDVVTVTADFSAFEKQETTLRRENTIEKARDYLSEVAKLDLPDRQRVEAKVDGSVKVQLDIDPGNGSPKERMRDLLAKADAYFDEAIRQNAKDRAESAKLNFKKPTLEPKGRC